MKRVKITDKRQSFATDSRSFMEDSIEFIHTSLSELGIAEKLVTKTELLAEEMIVQMIQHATTTDAVLYIRIRRFLGDTSVDGRGIPWYKIKWNGRDAWVSSRYTCKVKY